MMLGRLLDGMVEVGRVAIVVGDRPQSSFGAVPIDEPWLDVCLHVRDWRTAASIALDPELRLGEAYMDGSLWLEWGTLPALMEIIGRNLARRPRRRGLFDLVGMFARGGNSIARSRSNVEHHYDHSAEFYRLFLDQDLQYSCAYFARPDLSLEEAQEAKKRHIAAKLDLRDGQHVLDIGCGYGGMALTLARSADVRVTGITLSKEQLRVARERAAVEGLEARVHFRLADYRTVRGCFDRIVSVGMFEHVGREHFTHYFSTIRNLLADDGIALVHAIGRRDCGPGSDRWIEKHIFPGGYIAATSEALSAAEAADLWVTDVEILRLHYAETLRCWRERAEAHRDTIVAMYGDRFYRMWQWYLASCEMGFRWNGLMVFQVQLARSVDALPVTREYIARAENALGGRGVKRIEPEQEVAGTC